MKMNMKNLKKCSVLKTYLKTQKTFLSPTCSCFSCFSSCICNEES